MNTIIEKIRAEVERLMQGEQQEIKDMDGALVPNLRSYTKGKRDAFIDTLIVLDKLKELPITRDFNFDDEVVKWIQEHSDVDGTYSGIDFAHHFYELGRQSKEQPVCEALVDEIDNRWREWLSDDKEQVEGVLPKSEFAFYARHFYELGRQSKPKVRFPHEKDIVDKVFGAGNLDGWEYDEAEALVALAKEELLKDIEPKSSEGLEEEIKSFALNFYQDNGNLPMVADIARHFAQWQKEQMLKEAVEGRIESNGYQNYVSPKEPDFTNKVNGMNCGDKVRIIFVEEDEK